MRASTAFPKKTALGVEEMRQRTHGLSQRHRTMLLLVNGKRERHEVLTLARQAGVDSVFFDELVKMGLVDAGLPPSLEPKGLATDVPDAPAVAASAPPARPVPTAPRIEPRPPAAPAPARAPVVPPAQAPRPAAANIPSLPMSDAVLDELDPLLGASAPAPLTDGAMPPQVAAPKPKATAPAEMRAAVQAPHSPPTPAPAPAPAIPEGAPPARAARVRFTSPVHKPRAPARQTAPVEVRRAAEPLLTPARPPTRRDKVQMAAPAVQPDDAAEQRLLDEVRNLLIESLMVDRPVLGSLTVLRVRKASTRLELIALVWEIDRRLGKARRPRDVQSHIYQVRELLGLGNTVVAEDSTRDPPSKL